MVQGDRVKTDFPASRDILDSCPQIEHLQASIGNMPISIYTAVDR